MARETQSDARNTADEPRQSDDDIYTRYSPREVVGAMRLKELLKDDKYAVFYEKLRQYPPEGICALVQLGELAQNDNGRALADLFQKFSAGPLPPLADSIKILDVGGEDNISEAIQLCKTRSIRELVHATESKERARETRLKYFANNRERLNLQNAQKKRRYRAQIKVGDAP